MHNQKSKDSGKNPDFRRKTNDDRVEVLPPKSFLNIRLASLWQEVVTDKQTIRFLMPSFLQPEMAPNSDFIGATAASVALLPNVAITGGLGHVL